MSVRLFLSLSACALLGACNSDVPVKSAPDAVQIAATPSPAITAVPRPDRAGWTRRHNAQKARIAQGNADLLMIGDSITHGWERRGKEVWDQYYAGRNAVNLGIGGDHTQHVLWRLSDIDFTETSPKLAVLMIGTNNSSSSQEPGEIASGIIEITKTLQTKLPQTRVLVLGIFPRGTGQREARAAMGDAITGGAQWDKVEAVNTLIADYAAGADAITYLNINSELLTQDGALTRSIMPDLLHLSPEGYAIWAAAMEPVITDLMP